jgi:hypothetical protein
MSVDNPSSSSTNSPSTEEPFVDRRDPQVRRNSPGLERRQFSDGRASLSPDAAELGSAIDLYKLKNCRKYISYEEMLSVIKSLGYEKTS